MRISWKCDFCSKKWFYPSMDCNRNEKRSLRYANRQFCDDLCKDRWDALSGTGEDNPDTLFDWAFRSSRI